MSGHGHRDSAESGHKVGRSRVMTAADWDERYAEGRQWSVEANQFFAQVVEHLGDSGLTGDTALDLACGEGRNSVWLASRGWDVTAVDFAAAGIERGRSGASGLDVSIEWTVADLATWELGHQRWDLVSHVYLHWGRDERIPFLDRCADAVAEGGALVVIGHDRSNIAHGHGGPQDPELLTTPEELRDAFERAGLEVPRAELVYRDVALVDGNSGAQTTVQAIDHVVVARRR